MKFEDDFKEAIARLPGKEKDKLILRLLRHDPILIKQLYYQHVGTHSKEELRGKMSELVTQKITFLSGMYYDLSYFLQETRRISAEIAEHVKVTKDKMGEVSLNLQLLIEIFEINKEFFGNNKNLKYSKLAVYCIAKAFRILILIPSLHEDIQYDFKQDINHLGELWLANQFMMETSIYHGFDVNWLLTFEIPKDIHEQNLLLKRQGYLR